MRKCGYEDKIDEYLLDRMKPEEQTDFEEHYFICRSCFEKMSERNEIVQVLRKEGVLVRPEARPAAASGFRAWVGRVLAFLTPCRLAAVVVPTALVVLAVWLLIPRGGPVAPPLVLSGDGTVRGAAIPVVSPVAEVAEAPSYLEWKAVGEDIEYQVSLAGDTPLLNASTKETRVVLPEEARARLKPGNSYSWQVRAFKADGALLAESGRVKFRIRAKG
ncbi:MAG TPA: hypothetical protein VMS75_04470 [Terriglobales bacterium]|nr:hypothetical protein [Terriglobales bacterium]